MIRKSVAVCVTQLAPGESDGTGNRYPVTTYVIRCSKHGRIGAETTTGQYFAFSRAKQHMEAYHKETDAAPPARELKLVIR